MEAALRRVLVEIIGTPEEEVDNRRDGTPVATPVSIAFDADRMFFPSRHKAHKTKRLRNNPDVDVAPSTLAAKPTGPAVRSHATLLEGQVARVAARALAKRHPFLQAQVVPVAHRVMRTRPCITS